MALDEDVPVLLFGASTAMVGACLTVAGVLSLDTRLQSYEERFDLMLSLDAIGFLVAATLAYLALRQRTHRRLLAIERSAEFIFIASIILTTIICVLIVLLVD